MYMQAHAQLRKDELEEAQAEAWLLSLLSEEASAGSRIRRLRRVQPMWVYIRLLLMRLP